MVHTLSSMISLRLEDCHTLLQLGPLCSFLGTMIPFLCPSVVSFFFCVQNVTDLVQVFNYLRCYYSVSNRMLTSVGRNIFNDNL